MRAFGVLSLCLLLLGVASASTVGYTESSISSYNVMGRSGNSTLYNLTLSHHPYETPIYFVDLWGDRHTMGYDYGVLLNVQLAECYQTFFSGLLGGLSLPKFLVPVVQATIEEFLDLQWDNWLSQQVPQDYLDEINGINDGCTSRSQKDCGRYITRTIVLANLPGSLGDLKYVFEDEMNNWSSSQDSPSAVPSAEEWKTIVHNSLFSLPPGLQCSMFGVWGSRTAGGDLYSARNLDWVANLGLDNYKIVQVWHPDGAYEHSAVGYVCVWGALTGMSAKGVSVHEANLESDMDSFRGFPWLLRLRYIMENAASINEAWTLWENTNNTVGFNHMVASANDAANSAHGALALETMAGYTAYFLDNDPREASATVYNEQKGKNVRIGFPVTEALWRTNHGYDPEIRKHYQWSVTGHAAQWSEERYMFAAAFFERNQKEGILINHDHAINITAILGDKGPTAYHCQDSAVGSNIISVTFHPGAQEFWASWEDKSGSAWRPAACNNYVHFDLSRWFSQAV